MRYLLIVHGYESERLAKPPEWSEEVAAFLVKFEGRLAVGSEFDWSEVLAPDDQAIVVGPMRETRNEHYNLEGKPLYRLWAIRVDSEARAVELASELAGELDTWVEVRECLSASHRP